MIEAVQTFGTPKDDAIEARVVIDVGFGHDSGSLKQLGQGRRRRCWVGSLVLLAQV